MSQLRSSVTKPAPKGQRVFVVYGVIQYTGNKNPLWRRHADNCR
jgi:hypothetical protein